MNIYKKCEIEAEVYKSKLGLRKKLRFSVVILILYNFINRLMILYNKTVLNEP
jgi:hypothetical protein